MDAPPFSAPRPRYPVWLGVASFAWAITGWVLAASASRLAFLPAVEVLHLVLPGVTAVLILANLVFSLHALFRRKVPIERLLLVTGLQIGLFTTLFFQFATHLGAEYYSFQRPTRSWEWVQFSAAHAVRAADVLDAIEAYGWNIQAIKHRGPFVAAVVVAYYVVIDLFMLGLFWTILGRFKKRLLDEPARVAVLFLLGGLAFLIWFGVWMIFAWQLRPWRAVDVPLWFVENVVRVVDFADAMDSFDIHWHQVPSGPVESTLTFFCRVWIAIAISFGLSSWRTARGVAPPVVEEKPVSPWGFSRLGIAAVSIAAMVGADAFLVASTSQQIENLAAVATGDDEDRAERALAAIRRLGPNARDAVGPLAEARSRLPDRSDKILETLGYLGPKAIDPLRAVFSQGEKAEAKAALESLRRIGPKAAPALVAVWGGPYKLSLRAAAAKQLREFGIDAMPSLIEATDKTNSAIHLPWFDKLDRNWMLRGSDNPTFRALVQLRMFHDRVPTSFGTERPKGEFDDRLLQRGVMTGELMVGIRDCGTAGLPVFINALSNDDHRVRRIAIQALAELGPQATSAVLDLRSCLDPHHLIFPSRTLHKNDPIVRRLAADALGKIGPSAGEAEEALVKALEDDDEELRSAAARALGAIRPKRGQAVTALGKALADKHGEVRRAAAVALGMYGVAARRALPELMKLSSDEKIIGSSEARQAIERIRRQIELSWKAREAG